MAYKIEYIKGVAEMSPIVHKGPGKIKWSLAAIALAIIMFLAVYSVGQGSLYRALIPGDSVITEAAAVNFVNEVKRGTSVADAFGLFCKEIIAGAEIQDVH